MGTRRNARITAVQALYVWEDSRPRTEELLKFRWMDKRPGDREFATLLVSGTLENIEEIDRQIKQHLKRWSFERLSRIDLAIMRIAAYALLFQPDIPPSVTIDEAVEIAKNFGSPDSHRFVNGVLDGIRKTDLS